MKEDVALALSIVSIILSICNLVDVAPFRITSDSMLSASLAIVSICTAIIVAYQIFNNATMENRLRKLIGEEYDRKSKSDKAENKKFMAGNLFLTKFNMVVSMASSENWEAMYPIAVGALGDCTEDLADQARSLCGILKGVHEKIDIKKVCGYETYLDMEIRFLKPMVSYCDVALELLSMIYQAERK